MEQQLGNSGHTSKLLIGVEVQKFLTLVRFDQHVEVRSERFRQGLFLDDPG